MTARGITRPTTPLRVASRAPVFGGPLVLFANADAATPLKLPARDPAGRELTVHIETLPSAGSLTTIDGRELTAEVNNVPGHGVDNEFQVMYQLSSICQGDDIVDTFSYSAIAFGGESATGSVIVHCLELQSPDSRRLTNPSFVKSLEILEDTPAVLNLGAVGRNGEPLAVEITGLPDRGQLYQIEFAGENDYTYAAVVYPGSQPISQARAAPCSCAGLPM